MKVAAPAVRWLPVIQATLLRAALLLFVITLCLAAYKSYYLRHASHTQGVVVALEEVPVADASGGQPSIVYSPVFQYVINGMTHTSHANSGASPAAFSVGQRVEVLYLPDHPERAQLLALTRRWGMAEWFGIATAVTGIFGLGLRWARGSKSSWEYIPADSLRS